MGFAWLNVFSKNSVLAQVVPDKTLGVESSLINLSSDVDINGIPSTLIKGGAIRGENLFHSFEKFNVGEGRGVYFDNPVGIQRILSRVTGNGISEILGTLGVLGNADLFLINPNGIIFGPKTSLDVKGSFLATTASSLSFEDDTQFSAKVSSTPSLLTVSMPVGLQFREPSGDITQQPSSSNGIQGQPGKTVAFVGGNINVQGGFVSVPGGRIELGSVAGTSYVSLHPIKEGWALSYEGVQDFHDIQIIQGALLFVPNVSSLDVSKGDIQVRGRQLAIKDGSQIVGAEGNLKIVASETVEITGFSPNFPDLFSGLANGTFSDKDAGSITVNTKKLIIQDGGRISTTSSGLDFLGNQTIATGRGGNLIVNASESVELTGKSGALTGLFAGTESFGSGGNIIVNTQKLTIRDGANLSTETTGISSFGQPIATGAAGNININASKSIELNNGFISTATNGLGGSAGNLTIETGQINVSNGSEVSVSGREGQAGNLKITGNSLTLNRGSITAETGKSEVESGANITLQIRDLLSLANESVISATANGDAKGGSIDIDPTFVLVFPPTGPNGSDIIAKAKKGNGGNIKIDAQGIFGIAKRLSIPGNRTNDIDVSSEFGASGQVQINGTVDPNQGVAQIPETVVDPNALVSQSPCKRGSQSQFTRTGRGGLPPNLSDDLSGETTQVGLVKPAPSIVAEGQAQRTSSGVAPNENQTSKIENPIVPAQGWSFKDNGEVVLTAYNPTVTGPQRLQENPVGCPAF